jgi:hypothetical protein
MSRPEDADGAAEEESNAIKKTVKEDLLRRKSLNILRLLKINSGPELAVGTVHSTKTPVAGSKRPILLPENSVK